VLPGVKQVLEDLSGTTPLFLLPEHVLFPYTVQPYHIFEPRYVQMVRDALEGDRLITICQLKENGESGAGKEPLPFEATGTLGYINKVHSAPGKESTEGEEEERFNIWVTGLVKVEVAEVESKQPYRRGVVTPLREYGQVADEEHRRETILRLFQRILEHTETMVNLENLAALDVPIGMLAHVVISALPIPPDEKQKMLELPSLELRMDILVNFMESGLQTLGPLAQFDPILPSNPLWN
jgi:Lon protease-like protein